MNKGIIPTTILGKISVALHTFFLLTTITSILLDVSEALSFDEGHWWDITVAILVLTSLTALITGIIALKKRKDKSLLVKASITLGVLTILFLLTHSLYIND
jgi:hypothetical protein